MNEKQTCTSTGTTQQGQEKNPLQRGARSKTRKDEGGKKTTVEEVRRLFRYDSNTGKFFWLVSTNRRIVVGSEAGVDWLGYRKITVRGRLYQAHRIAWLHFYGEWPSGCIDHINHITNDNSIANLRDGSHAENMGNLNRPMKHNTSGVLGVSWHKAARKWWAQITLNRVHNNLGLFDNKDDAQQAYLNAKRKLHKFCTI